MAVQIEAQTYTYRDARGNTGRVRIYISADNATAGSGDAANAIGRTIEAEITALTNAALVSSTGPSGRVIAPNTYGGTGTYQDVADKLRIRLLAVDNTVHSLQVPAPVSTAFLADQETAKGSAIAALIATIVAAPIASAFVCTRAGASFPAGTASLGGSRVRKAKSRKETIYQKSSNLDEPEE